MMDADEIEVNAMEKNGQLSFPGFPTEEQESVNEDHSPAEIQNKKVTQKALDELFSLSVIYKSSESYHNLLKFIAKFRTYTPFNAMLVHIQMPGAVFVAPPHRWIKEYGRQIKANARPLVILQPMGPVMFVFDISDTEPMPNATHIPPEIEMPFEVRSGNVGNRFNLLIENAKRDGVRTTKTSDGSQSAGSIEYVHDEINRFQKFQSGLDSQRNPIFEDVLVRYDLLYNGKGSNEAAYATIVHELAHLYCGHLGSTDEKLWLDRRGLSNDAEELEAESVSYLVCSRAGIDSPSERYLSRFVAKKGNVPKISLECVMKAAGLIEKMSIKKMKMRKGSV